jgi:hypothetical protein
MVSHHFHTSSEKLIQPPREWWKVDSSSNIQMESFTKLSEVDPSIPEPKSDNKITLFSKIDDAEFVVDMVEHEELKRYCKEVNRPNGQVWKEVVDSELDRLDMAGTWDVVDKIEGGKEVGSKWVFKVKRLADGSIDKFKAQLIAQDYTQRPSFNFDETYAPIVHFDSLRLLLAITAVQG